MARFGVGDRNVVDLERAAHGAIEIYFGLRQVDARADLGAGGRGESILIGNDVEQRRSSQLIFLLFGVQGLLIEIACLGGGLQRDAGLLEDDLRVVNINRNVIHNLPIAGFVLPRGEQRRDIVTLRLAVSDWNRQAQLRVVLGINTRKHITKSRNYTWGNLRRRV